MKVTLTWQSSRSDTIDADADETILEAAEDAGTSLPFGCRRGACATCVGRLLEGSVEHRRPPRALKDSQLAEEYILLCIAEPRTPCRIAVGTAVHAELLSNPWRPG